MYLFMLFLKIFLMYLYILAQVHKAFLCCCFVYFFFRTKQRFDSHCIHLLVFFLGCSFLVDIIHFAFYCIRLGLFSKFLFTR